MYLGRNGYGFKTMLGIAVALTAEKVHHPGNGRKSATGWRDNTISYILRNSAYVGEFRYKDVKIPLPELAIIDRSTFDQAQTQRGKNARQAQRNRKYDYLLAGGLLRCRCGAAMTARSAYAGRKRYYYYVCCHQGRRYLDHYTCREGGVRADKADAVAWEWVCGLLADDRNIEVSLLRMAEQGEFKLSAKRERLASVDGLLEQIDAKIERLATAYADAEYDMVAAALGRELKTAGKQQEALQEERSVLLAEIEQGRLLPDEIEAIKQFAADLHDELDNTDFKARRYLIDRLNFRAQVKGEGDDRILWAACEITPEAASLSIARSYSQASAIYSIVFKNCRQRRIALRPISMSNTSNPCGPPG